MDKCKDFFLEFFKIAALIFLFYKNIFLCILLGILVGFWGIKRGERRRKERRRQRLSYEFREGMQSISAALNAGYSIENSFVEGRRDLLLLYGEKSVLAEEFNILINELRLNVPVEEALFRLAKRTEVESINTFSKVFFTTKRMGGDLISVTKDTANRISEKIEVKREIETIISGKSMEAKFMNLIPPGFIVYFWLTSPDFLDPLYRGPGRFVMTVLLIIYVLAMEWSKKIMDIEV